MSFSKPLLRYLMLILMGALLVYLIDKYLLDLVLKYLSKLLLLYTLIVLVVGLLLLLIDKLWVSNHIWHLSHSKLLTCTKCGNIFQLQRQSVDRRCPQCGGKTKPFQMPYSGLHETLRDRARNLKET